MPVLFFSLFKTKHHHYMSTASLPLPLSPLMELGRFGADAGLAAMAAFALDLAAVGRRARGDRYLRFPRQDSGAELGDRGVAIFWVVVAFASWWVIGRPNRRLAFVGFSVIVLAVHTVVYEYRTDFAEEYGDDIEFLKQAQVATEKPLFVLGEFDPLNASWTLFYLNGQGKLLHNDTYLHDDQITAPTVAVICQQRYEPYLNLYGKPRAVLQTRHARYERSVDDRYTLYELTFYPNLMRVTAELRMTPLQATGRDVGPFLGQTSQETAQR